MNQNKSLTLTPTRAFKFIPVFAQVTLTSAKKAVSSQYLKSNCKKQKYLISCVKNEIALANLFIFLMMDSFVDALIFRTAVFEISET